MRDDGIVMRTCLAVLSCSLLGGSLLGCATSVDLDDVSAEAPLVGVDGSRDQADRACHVVLRELQRNWTGFTWETEGTSWVWQGTVELSDEAAAEGLVPQLLYRSGSDPSWRAATAVATDAPATPGFARYTVRIAEGLPGPGMSASSLGHTRIEVVPFAVLGGGGRLFDHNRHPNDFDNYVITSPSFAIPRAATVCAPPAGPTRARLVFDADWSERREGTLVPGGELAIVFDPARLAQCRNSQNGVPRYDLTAHVRFEPGTEVRSVSVRDGAPTLAVPAGTRGVSLWFENTSAGGCQAWDSNLGQNYSFDVFAPGATAPQWAGEVQNLLVRDAADPCASGAAATDGFSFDTYTRQRAAHTNLCFQVYHPGVTDRDDPDLWQKLDVQLHWRLVGQAAFETRYVSLDRRVGNNARYRFSWREVDPFRMYHCPEVEPAPSPLPPAGHYEQVELEYYVTINGAELRPAPGATFRGTFVDYAADAFRAQSCTY